MAIKWNFRGIVIPVPIEEIASVRVGRTKRKGRKIQSHLEIRTVGGKRRRPKRGIRSQEHAEGVAADLRKLIEKGDCRPAVSLTVEQAADRWLTYLQKNRYKPSTIALYRHSLRMFRDRVGDQTPLAEIGEDDIISFQQRRMAEGRDERTIRTNLACVRIFFNWCEDERAIKLAPNPFPRAKKLKMRKRKKKYRTLEPNEFGELLEACDPWLRDVVVFAFLTGARKGEIQALEWPWINLHTGVLSFMEDKLTDEDEPREIALHPVCLEILKRRYEATRGKGKVFLGRYGRPLTKHVGRSVTLAARKAGLGEGICFHTLRRTFNTALLRLQTDPKTTQGVMRHSSAEMTLLYAGSTSALRVRAVANVWQVWGRISGASENGPQNETAEVIEIPRLAEGQ
jgi:integrase/recombinase XerD